AGCWQPFGRESERGRVGPCTTWNLWKCRRGDLHAIMTESAIRARATPGHGSLIRFQHREERVLRDRHHADLLHSLLALGLLGEQFALSRDVAAVAFCRHVLADRRDRLAGDHP